jgi:hypothetical protein
VSADVNTHAAYHKTLRVAGIYKVYSFEQAREAYARLPRREQFGKIVLRVG